MSTGSTELAVSISEVRIIIPRTQWMHSQMAFALRILDRGWLTFYAIALHVFKFHLNSDPVSYNHIDISGIYTTRFCQLIDLFD